MPDSGLGFQVKVLKPLLVSPLLLGSGERERDFFIDNLPVRIHFIIEMVLVDRPRAIGVRIPLFR